jgi:hypothetical protein
MSATNRKLGDDDALAVDLLLDRSCMVNNGNGGSGVFAAPVGDSVARRLGAAESLLRLVAQMPMEDPPTDLLHRTLERIRQHGRLGAQPVEGASPQPNLGSGSNQA